MSSAQGHRARLAAALTGQLAGVPSATGIICRSWFRSLPRAHGGGICVPVQGAAGHVSGLSRALGSDRAV